MNNTSAVTVKIKLVHAELGPYNIVQITFEQNQKKVIPVIRDEIVAKRKQWDMNASHESTDYISILLSCRAQ